MKTLKTLFGLYREAKRAAAIHSKSMSVIFYTLVSLYVKSRLAGKSDKIISHSIGQFRVYAYDYPTLIELYREIFLEAVYQFETSEATPLIIDCGANIGMSVLFFKENFPQSEIWAFEPNPSSFSLLEKNIKDNNIDNVTLFPIALSDMAGTIDFYVHEKKGSLNASSRDVDDNGKRIKVEAKKLSDYLNEKRVACIKIDIEGDEEKVIWDLADNQKLHLVDRIIVEYHSAEETEAPLSLFLNFMNEAGFKYRRLTDDTKRDVIFVFNKKPYQFD